MIGCAKKVFGDIINPLYLPSLSAGIFNSDKTVVIGKVAGLRLIFVSLVIFGPVITSISTM